VTVRLYRDDPYLLDFDARVTERRLHVGRPALLLDRTAFYPESGGQPCDTGTIEGVAVVAVLEDGEAIVHVLADELPAAQTVRARVDGERRRDHREQHHGQHLLSRAFVELHRAETIGFHLGAEATTIDLDREVTADQAAEAAARASEIAWAALPVATRMLDRAEAVAAAIDLKDAVGDEVRIVEVPGFDRQPCCGTHPRSTAEVGVVLVTGVERYKGGSRVAFLCGHRALRGFRARNETLARLAGVLSTPVDGLVEAAGATLARLREEQLRGRALLEAAIEGEARALLAKGAERPAVVVACFDGRPLEEVRALAMRLVALGRCVALLGTRSDKAQVVFAQSEGLPLDVPALVRDAAAALGGRGGGRGNLAQGGGDRVERLAEALAAAESAAGARLGPGA
jgi:alanyl-tRNA synthetase